MSDTTTEDEIVQAVESDDKHRILATDLRVGAEGDVTIPSEKRDRYGIEPGDYVDAIVYADCDGEGDAQ